ncbi:MAG: uroporphyrinogen decarboxylase [Candidatus Desulfatibia sp.]|uniref:uroporphyrinogen decarboxylase n=1 Tax=Candidatus Desulfatibia sp. TaxID=3101189 RepID=UPI002F2CAD8C
MTNLENDLFLRACKRLTVERTPIWVMRQAGRYLPEYRAVRQKYDFLTMCKTPELAAEVTLQPIDLIGVDAAIIFSDILVIPEAMGMHLEMHENRGPVFPRPIRNEEDAKNLKQIDPTVDLQYVLDAVALTKKALNRRVPLIGFSGSPWTLLAYMVEGQGSKNFSKVKHLIYNNPKLAHSLLDKIADAVAVYLCAKIEAGADAVQIFDTWGGLLSQDDFEEFSLQYIRKIISQVKGKDVPVIMFAKGVHFNLDNLAASGADVLGLDWTMNIGDVRKKVGDKVALQGNLDPTVLYAGHDKIRLEAGKILKSFGEGRGHIFNLGHGILPDVPPENLKALVDFVKAESGRYHLNDTKAQP